MATVYLVSVITLSLLGAAAILASYMSRKRWARYGAMVQADIDRMECAEIGESLRQRYNRPNYMRRMKPKSLSKRQMAKRSRRINRQ